VSVTEPGPGWVGGLSFSLSDLEMLLFTKRTGPQSGLHFIWWLTFHAVTLLAHKLLNGCLLNF
jgi:hypothetical protein